MRNTNIAHPVKSYWQFSFILGCFYHENMPKTQTFTCPQNSAIFVLQKRWGGSGERLFETFPKIHPFLEAIAGAE